MIDPAERIAREQKLGVCDGEERPVTSAGAAMVEIDVGQREHAFAWRRVYLARYMRLSIADIERTPIPLLDRYCEALAEIFKAESPGSIESKAEQDFT